MRLLQLSAAHLRSVGELLAQGSALRLALACRACAAALRHGSLWHFSCLVLDGDQRYHPAGILSAVAAEGIRVLLACNLGWSLFRELAGRPFNELRSLLISECMFEGVGARAVAELVARHGVRSLVLHNCFLEEGDVAAIAAAAEPLECLSLAEAGLRPVPLGGPLGAILRHGRLAQLSLWGCLRLEEGRLHGSPARLLHAEEAPHRQQQGAARRHRAPPLQEHGRQGGKPRPLCRCWRGADGRVRRGSGLGPERGARPDGVATGRAQDDQQIAGRAVGVWHAPPGPRPLRQRPRRAHGGSLRGLARAPRSAARRLGRRAQLRRLRRRRGRRGRRGLRGPAERRALAALDWVAGGLGTLRVLDASRAGLEDAALVGLEAARAGAAGLAEVDLSHNMLTEDGAAALLRTLAHGGSQLRRLDLAINYRGGARTSPPLCALVGASSCWRGCR
ncbi:unnamed protein product [Prorocentrum cordatum]|nr:unnamed protein product [Polarella glacialis]